jgi:hypothetical protein
LLTAKGSKPVEAVIVAEVGMAAEDIIKAVSTLDGAGFSRALLCGAGAGPYQSPAYALPFRQFSELEHVKTMATAGSSRRRPDGGGDSGFRTAVCLDRIWAGYDHRFIGPSAKG